MAINNGMNARRVLIPWPGPAAGFHGDIKLWNSYMKYW